ncbi:inorganic phosphate transporter Pho86p [Diutina catenulata]
MVEQVKLNLNEPINAEAKPTLTKTPLVPKYATAAANLQGDYYSQELSKLNKFLFWNKWSKLFMVVVFSGTLLYKLWDYISVSDSIGEFIEFFTRGEIYNELFVVFPALIAILLVVGLSIYLISDDIKEVSKEFVQKSYVNKLFGFDLTKFAKLDVDSHQPQQRKSLRHGDNTQIIVYRESPIAIATVLPDEKSSVSDFIVRIQGLNVRKVYSKVDFDQLVLEWSIIRARQLLQQKAEAENVQSLSGSKVTVLIDAYSFDDERVRLLTRNGFSPLTSTFALNPYGEGKVSSTQAALQSFFGVNRTTYGLVINVDNEDSDLLMKAAKSSGFVAAPSDKVKKRR